MSTNLASRSSHRAKRKQVYEKTNGRCVYCMDAITFKDFHVDHLYPFSKGGNSDIHNLLPSCSRCNLTKSDKLVVENIKIKTITKVNTRFVESSNTSNVSNLMNAYVVLQGNYDQLLDMFCERMGRV